VASTVQIDKLLATVIQLKASDLHISVGQPPVVRHHGRMRRLEAKILDNDDTTALMKAIQANQLDAVVILHRRGASLDRTNRSGVSARQMAAQKNDLSLNEALNISR